MQVLDLEQRITSTMQNYQNLISSRAKLNSLLPQTTAKESVMHMLNEYRNNKKIRNQIHNSKEGPTSKKEDEVFNSPLDFTKNNVPILNKAPLDHFNNSKNYHYINYEKDFNEKTEDLKSSNLKLKPTSNYNYNHNHKLEQVAFTLNTDRNFCSLQKKIDLLFSPLMPQKNQNFTERKNYNLNQQKNECVFEKKNCSLLSNFSNKENLNSEKKKNHQKNNNAKTNPSLQFNPNQNWKMMTTNMNNFSLNQKENTNDLSCSERSPNISKSIITNKNELPVEDRMALRDINKNINIEKMIFEKERKVLRELKEKPDISINSKKLAYNTKARKREPDLLKRLLTEKQIQQTRNEQKSFEKQKQEFAALTFEPKINSSSKKLHRTLSDLFLWDKTRKNREDQSRTQKIFQNQQRTVKKSFISNDSYSLLEKSSQNLRKKKIEGSQTREANISELKSIKILDLNSSKKRWISHGKSMPMAIKHSQNYQKNSKEKNEILNLEKNIFQTERNDSIEERKRRNLSTSYSKLKSDRLHNKSKERERSNHKSKSFFFSDDQIIRLFSPHQFVINTDDKSKAVEVSLPKKKIILKDENIEEINFPIHNYEKPDANTFSFGYTHNYINNFKIEENHIKGKKLEERKDVILGNDLISPRISDFQPNEKKEENAEIFMKLISKNNKPNPEEDDEEHDYTEVRKKSDDSHDHYDQYRDTNEGYGDQNENKKESIDKNFINMEDNFGNNESKEKAKEGSNMNLNVEKKKNRFMKSRNNVLNLEKTEEGGEPGYADLHRKRTQSYSNATYLKRL